MTFLPILERELRVRARSRVNYWGRFGIGLAGVVIGLPPLFLSGIPISPAALGRGVFTGIMGAAFLLCCAACLVTVDSISAERREGTLGLLFLTRVRGFDVLVGKFASSGLTCFFALVAVLPVLMVPVLAGGVTGGEVARKGLVLVDLLFVALSAGLWASARADERFRSVRDALLLVSLLVLVPSLLGRLLRWPELELLSPLGALLSAADNSYRLTPGHYWISVCLVQAVGWGLLFAAVAGLRVSSPRQAPVAVRTIAPTPVGEVARPARHRFPGTTREPTALHWLLRRQRGLRVLLWVAASMSCLHYAFYWVFGRFGGPRSVGIQVGASSALSLVTGGISGSLIAWVASRFFVESRRTGELELLLTTPLGTEAMVPAQWDVLKRLVRWPLILMLAPMLLQGVSVLALRGYWPGLGWKLNYAGSLLLSAINTVVGIGALCWLGLWFGLRAGGQARAILWTVALGRGLPYMLSMTWYVLSNLLVPALGRPTSTVPWILTSLIPQMANLALSVWWICLARRQMRLDLSGTQPLAIREMLSGAVSGTAAVVRHVRHWTPG